MIKKTGSVEVITDIDRIYYEILKLIEKGKRLNKIIPNLEI